MSALHGTFGPRQYMFDAERGAVLRAHGGNTHIVDVVISTTRGLHLLDDAALAAGAYTHRPADVEPELLGFECQAVLAEALGSYDYYCYAEHDLVIHDPWFFAKIEWFNGWAGDGAVLLPNRYERDAQGGGRKAYVDPRIPASESSRFQDTGDRPALAREVMGRRVVFQRPSNPHAACYFLDARQMAHWASRPHFLDRDTSFVGPYESAGTLGIMRTFRLYKAAPRWAGFLEVEHADRRFISLIEPRTPLGES